MFVVDEFVAACLAAIDEPEPRLAVRDVLARAIAQPAAVAATLSTDRAEIERLHVSDRLTVLKVVWAPGMSIRPHDHRMWAAIGIFGGQEDNALYRRSADGLVVSGGKSLETSEVLLLGDDTIHSVHNPLGKHTGAIHVYGGDFFATPRSEWDSSTGAEQPYDVARTLRLFEEANGPSE